MSRLRKILFWLGGIVCFLAIGLLVFVWVGLGVNPFEGRQEYLYELTSSEVNFYVRFPGTRLLKDPVLETLAEEDGFGGIADLRDELDDFTRQLAEQTAGQIPFLDKIDFERDIAGNEMAIGGAIMGDYHQLKVDNFVLLTRISAPIKFVSALKRGFVRDQIPEAKGISLVKGLYFRIEIDPEVQEALDSFRSLQGGAGERNVLYMVRIKDVLVISDSDAWIEHAIYGRKDVLRADAWFETQFTRSSAGGDAVEAFFRLGLTSHALQAHSREPGSLLHVMEKLLPIEMAGDVFLQAKTSGSNEIQIKIDDLPGKKSFEKMAPYLQRLYDEEKVDIAMEMGPEGIGRFIPRRRVVGAMIVRAESRELVDMVLALLPDIYRDIFDKEVRNSSNGRFPDFERLMRHLTQDLGDTHLLIFHRPSVFEDAPWHLYEEPADEEPRPKGQLALSIVSRLKDSVSPAAVEKRISENLVHLGLNSAGINKKYNFRKASPVIREEELEIFDPAFGALGGRFVFFSSMWEAAEAVHEAAADENARMVTSTSFRKTLASLPSTGTLGLIIDGKTLAKSMYDGVRTWATQRMGVAHERGRIADKFRSQGLSEEAIHEKINNSIGMWKQERYEELRGEFEKLIEPFRALDSIGLVASLGVGPHKKVTAELRVRLVGGTDGPAGE